MLVAGAVAEHPVRGVWIVVDLVSEISVGWVVATVMHWAVVTAATWVVR